MKKITLVMALLCAISLFGQKRISARVQTLVNSHTTFKPVQPLRAETSRNAKADAVVKNATYATLNQETVKRIADNKYPFIELSIPYNGENIAVLLYRTEVMAQGFHVDTDKQKNLPYNPGAYYRGIVKGDYKSVVAFSFFKDGMNGIVSAKAYQNLVVGKLKNSSTTGNYIIYSDAKMNVDHSFKCAADEKVVPPGFQPKPNTLRNIQSEHCATIYFEMDYTLYEENGGSVEESTNWMTGLFNNVQALYDNDGITTALKSVFVWTEEDPYDGGLGSSDYLYRFYANRTSFDGDAGMLLGIDEGGLGGVAMTIGGLCSTQRVSYSDVDFDYEEVPVFSWNVQVVTHELGHLFGSPHTHGCYWNGDNTAIDGCGSSAGFVEGECEDGPIPDSETGGTIMSYCHLVEGVGINFANGFGPQPAQRIQDHFADSMCLSTDCINTCISDIVAIDVTDTSLNSISIRIKHWENEDSPGPWEVAIAAYGETPNVWIPSPGTDFVFTGLTPGTYYNIAARRSCNDVQVTTAEEITVMTGADWCNGFIWRDPEGNGNYLDMQKVITIVKSPDPNTVVAVVFSMFETEPEFDNMYIYDGIGTTAPLLGQFNGYDPPETFTTQNADGALTFVFNSDPYITFGGWYAQMNCTLSTQNNTYSNLSYYPNPVNNKLTISATESISHIAIYNVAGQLLSENKIGNVTSYETDMSAFATGIYLVKVSNGSNSATLKVIKN